MEGQKKGYDDEDRHIKGSKGITKFYVARLPERCSSKDIEKTLGVFGSIEGVYVARKRDKNGFRFGFVSFKGVKDASAMEKDMKNVWMGSFKLFINIARFSMENEEGKGNRNKNIKIQKGLEQEGMHNLNKKQGGVLTTL